MRKQGPRGKAFDVPLTCGYCVGGRGLSRPGTGTQRLLRHAASSLIVKKTNLQKGSPVAVAAGEQRFGIITFTNLGQDYLHLEIEHEDRNV